MQRIGEKRIWEKGNILVLTLYQCLFLLLVTLGGLDIFSILYVRRAAQTAADAAALGALRAVQNDLGPLLYDQADEKVRAWFREAREKWEEATSRWNRAYDNAKEKCRSEHTDEEGNLDKPAYNDCVDQWRERHAKPDLEDIEWGVLQSHVPDPAIVAALLGENAHVTLEEIVLAVLSPSEQRCIFIEHAEMLEYKGAVEAEKYAILNGAELGVVELPWEMKAQVYVQVERPIPTVVLSRLSGQPLTARAAAASTVLDLADEGVYSGGC